ncbi:hypothetical protein PENTCL1PPCAC_29015 [Pristionchus entomophagus]|uniref:Peptidase S1 domain-containing protein n=1 Tax=Pristionchus entomophagus TaxID=358040 RepID=A0AAV5UIK0_9BILA|nr:hypothetical protein PENTCL1PPCAC_29015 [Pristionchus entomophagus]
MKLAILLSIASSVLASSQCGIRIAEEPGRHERAVIGSDDAPKGRWPWQIYLAPRFCGGTVISDRWILTAAHCVENREMQYVVYDGISHRNESMLDEDPENVVKSNVTEIKTHPDYINGTLRPSPGDIALLKLSTPFTFNHLVTPICLPSLSQPIQDDGHAVITGFGLANEKGPYNSTRVKVTFGQLKETNV